NIYDLWFVNDQLGFCGGQGGTLARTTDGGVTWELLDSPTNSDIHSLFFLNDTLGFYSGNGGARTTDGGDTWTLLPELPQFTMSIFFPDPDTGYAVQFSGYVLRTTNGGDNWDMVVPAPFDVGLNDAQLVDGALLAVGDQGDVFRAALGCPPTPHIPTVLQSGSTLCTAYCPTIQWFLNGEPLPDATGPCITATEPGTYTVVITDALGCTSAPSAPVQVIITGVDTPTAIAPLLHPNPGTGNYQLRFAEARPRLLHLHDLQGRLLHQQRSTGPKTELNVEHLPAGIYVLSAEGEAWGLRVVKE
ncbi:MAG TPA: YCF48-related protein, partial [Flavobacteriales bacterium]|nr:YCF48-related protein [Flavobacteriales bacterium]